VRDADLRDRLARAVVARRPDRSTLWLQARRNRACASPPQARALSQLAIVGARSRWALPLTYMPMCPTGKAHRV